MSQAVIQVGEKIHLVTRQLFREDLRRHFVGEVTAYSGLMMRVEGFVFVLNPQMEEYRRRPERRIRIFGLADAGFIINILPPSLDLDQLHYAVRDGRLSITDGKRFALDMAEYSPGWSASGRS